MKRTQGIFRLKMLFMTIFFMFFILSACGSDPDVETHTVSFESNEGPVIEDVDVQVGRRLLPPDFSIEEEGLEFVGWFKDIEFQNQWNFDLDIVTEDITLYAQFLKIEPFPTEIEMTQTAFSSTVTWVQSGVSEDTLFRLTFYQAIESTDSLGNVFYQYESVGDVVEGTHTMVNDTTIEWVPNEPLQGGVYKVVILTDDEDEVSVEGLQFKGEGTESNPYLIFESFDIATIANQDQVGLGIFYALGDNVTHESSYNNIQGNQFQGYLDGNGYEVHITGNAGMFYELAETVVIDNLVITGTVLTNTTPLIGGVTHHNRGTIKNTVSWITITSSAGEVGNSDAMLDGGAGGLVGINHEGAIIEDCMFRSSGSSVGVIKAEIGAGGVASINYGRISNCENRGALGAFNAVESGRSLSRYSYMGGIAGFNYGLIEQSSTTSVGKLLAQRYWNVEPPEGTSNNRVLGGIVGYNGADGVIRESYFNGIRVHGDEYVGGIAGINAGLITHSYAGARYYSALSGRSYVGGRINVGGIAGKLEGDGRIEYSYASINVYAYEEDAYAIAEEAFNSVYIERNHDFREDGIHEYGDVPSNILIAPSGTGNTAVDNIKLAQGDGVFYELPGSYADILGTPFISKDGQTILAWEEE